MFCFLPIGSVAAFCAINSVCNTGNRPEGPLMQDKPYLGVGGCWYCSIRGGGGAGDHLPAHSLNDLQRVWTNHSHSSGPISTSQHQLLFFETCASYQCFLPCLQSRLDGGEVTPLWRRWECLRDQLQFVVGSKNTAFFRKYLKLGSAFRSRARQPQSWAGRHLWSVWDKRVLAEKHSCWLLDSVLFPWGSKDSKRQSNSSSLGSCIAPPPMSLLI